MDGPVIEVTARTLRPGDVLCTQLDRPSINVASAQRSWRVQSAAIEAAMEYFVTRGEAATFWRQQRAINELCATVKAVSTGWLYTKCLLRSGARVRLKRNSFLAVYRSN